MKILCNREQLLQAFQTVAGVAPVRSPKPILQNVKMDVTEQDVTLMATDLEVGIRHSVLGGEVEVPGVAVLSVSRFGSILREGTDETLHLETDGDGVTIRGQRSQYHLASEQPALYPEVATFQENGYFTLPARLLREMIRRTVFATDNESSRYRLGGVKLEVEENRLTAVGTDGRRLATMVGPIDTVGEVVGIDQATIVPTKAMLLIDRAFASCQAEVKFAVVGSELLVQSDRATISARLLDGRFPEWRKVFPDQSGGLQLELAVGSTLAAVRQAAIVTSEESRGIDFQFGGGMLVLSGRAAEVGQSRVELPIGYDGEELMTSLDPRFIIDFLKVLDPDKTFTLSIKDEDSAAVCSTDDGYAYVIMPLARDR
jgi:DNA polymerase III subunit beta